MANIKNHNSNILDNVNYLLDNIGGEEEFHIAFFFAGYSMERLIKNCITKHYKKESFEKCKTKRRRYSFIDIRGDCGQFERSGSDFTHMFCCVEDGGRLRKNKEAMLAISCMISMMKHYGVEMYFWIEGERVENWVDFMRVMNKQK